MVKHLRQGAAGLLLCVASTPAVASDHGWSIASGVGRDLLVGAALGVPAVQGDWSGDLQAGGSVLLGWGASDGLKHIFPERRPDNSDDRSFPSGHAAVSFAAAATLENRYGWKVGLPAFLVASFVGAGRVEARKHHWYDVAAGAAIGTGSGFLLTSKRNDGVRLVPFAHSRGCGISLAARF
ncbi:phosphatase PAP2 family protein [Sphingomonas sp.]|uniref:phosphatase PAP2 family protein n=1 Tax=Sphingomonas sp. TaxID=28214 RepID=UPI003B00BC01